MKKQFKPNLIPNNPKDGSFKISTAIEKNGGIKNYCITLKKDGCRLQAGISDTVLSRSLKKPGSKLVVDKFQKLNDICLKHNITLDGEFYRHGLKFNAIFRFFSKSDVTTEEYRKSLEKELRKDAKKFSDKYDGLDIPFLTDFNKDLKFWIFDGTILDRPDIKGYEDRMNEIYKRLDPYKLDEIEWPVFQSPEDVDELNRFYELSLDIGFEGLVLTHKDHEYKFGRNSLNQGTLLKMKDDAIEYDGIVLDIKESSVVKEGVEKTKNELGRSVTSKKVDDRIPSGMAKSFTVQFGELGTFDVGLKGFDHESRKELLENKNNYIGRHFKYKAMAPVKSFPRHAYFDCWRDEK